MYNKEDFIKLKGQIHSIEDLRRVADRHGIIYSSKQLEEVYNELQHEELNLDNLEAISGGQLFDCSNTDNGKTNSECKKCRRIFEQYKNGKDSKCPYCGTINNYKSGC